MRDYDRKQTASQFLTEVQGGSDVGASAVEARPVAGQPNAWLLRGEKWFCSVANGDQKGSGPGHGTGTSGASAWRPFDLYLFRDDAVAFYVGQSYIHYAPCFNVTLNARPTPLPAQYAPPGQRITCPRSLTKLINQASIVVKADNRRKWLELETTVQA